MPASPPRVIAVVVSHNGRPFLRDTFRGLAAQTRPIDDILVIDTGSRDGSAEWARMRLGDDAVAAVRGQFGRAVTTALRDPRTNGYEWLWLLHDDSSPEAEALEQLLGEADSRPSAWVLGPKLVDWNDPDRLREVGFLVDRTGRAVSPIEDDEIDQGQHDQIRDVFYVSTAGMLVRRQALVAVGGFDTRMPGFRDDLDLCWRTHLMGGRVLSVPTARVRHFGAAASRARRTRSLNHGRYLAERHTAATLLKATALRRLPLVLTLALVGMVLRVAALALTGRPGDALQVLWAWGWNVKELPVTLIHRRRLQRRRKLPDAALEPLRAPGGQRLRALFRSLLELVYGDIEGAHAAQTPTGDEQELPAPSGSLLRFVAGYPLAFMLAGFAVLMALSMRSLLVAGGISGGAMAPFPPTAHELLREFGAAFHDAGLGGSDPAPPSLALLAGASVVALGKTLLAQKLLLWLALPVAMATCSRALRPLVPDLVPRAIASLLYAASPLALGALAQGRLDVLVFLVLGPPACAQVLAAFQREQPRERWRPALRFALLAAVIIAMCPPAAVVLGLVVAVAVVAALVRPPGGARRWALWQGMLLAGGYLLALVLLEPWSGLLLTGGAGLAAAGRPLATPSLFDLVQLRPGGPGVLGVLLGPAYPALALAALFFVPAARRKQAFWLLMGLVAAAFVGALQAKELPVAFTDWPAVALVPGAVAWTAAAGLALTGLGAALADVKARSSPRRVLAVGVTLVTVASSVLVGIQLVRGDWTPLGPVEGRALPATVALTDSRVLWLAGRDDGGVDFAVTGPHGRTLLDSGRVAPEPAAAALREVVTDVVQARTHRAAALLQVFGIGYVAVRQGPGDERLVDLVARQQDLRTRPSEQAGLFQGPEPVHAWRLEGAEPAAIRNLLRREGMTPLAADVPVDGPATILLPEPADGAWQASIGGTELRPVRVMGWAQGFEVPAGVSGTPDIHRTGQATRNRLLLLEGLLVLAAIATMLRPTRVAPPPAPVSRYDDTTGDLRLVATLSRGGAR